MSSGGNTLAIEIIVQIDDNDYRRKVSFIETREI